MANTKVTGNLIASGTITADNLVSGTLDTLLNSYLTTNTYATQSYVTTAINNLIDAAPASLDTLNELAAALNDDANFATTVTNSLATKLNLSGGTLTGSLGIGRTPASTVVLDIQESDIGADLILGLTAGTGGRSQIRSIAQVDSSTSELGFYTVSGNTFERLRIESDGDISLGNIGAGTYSWIRPYTSGTGQMIIDADKGASGTNSAMLFQIRGTERMRIDSSGNVGIGTNAVGAKLHIVGSGENGGILFNVSSQQEHRFYSSANTQFNSIGSSTPIWHWAQYTGVGVTPNYKMTLNNTGLGIGTTSPEKRLHLVATNDAASIRFANTASSKTWDLTPAVPGISNTGFSLYNLTDDVVPFHVTNDGNVGIGTSSPDALLEISKNAGADPAPVDGPVTLRLTDAGNAANGLGDTTNPWAEIQFYSEDASSGGPAIQAKIATIYDDVYSAGSHITFSNTATPTNGLSERMRITSVGKVGIGTNTPGSYNSYADNLVVADAAHSGISIVSGTTSLGTLMFADGTGGTAGYRGRVQYDHNTDSMNFHTAAAERMRIASNGAVFMPFLVGSSGYNDLAYNTANGQLIYRTSSLRYKENIQDLPSALDKVNNLRTVTYDEKETGRSYFGLIAEELYEHIPELVTMKKIEGFNEPQPDGITYSMLSVYLLKAMQEQQEIINDLKAEIETLKSQINP